MTYPWAPLCDAALDRFMSKVEFDTNGMGCHLWAGAVSRGRGNSAWYGSFNVGCGYVVRANIFICVAHGIGQPGQHRDHLCKQTLCVRLDHFEAVTPRENALRRWQGRRLADKTARLHEALARVTRTVI